MKVKSRYIVILALLFGYVLLQFVWWEILLVKQTGTIINEEQKLMELTSTNAAKLKSDVDALHHRKNMQTIMIVGEGTVFLLLLLYGIYKIKQSHDKETLLNTQQNNFFLSITHELKTPIAATKLQLQTLQKQKLDEQTQKELLANALIETERLNLLIDNVLLASSLDNRQLRFSPERFDLSMELNSLLNRYYKKEMERGALTLNLAPAIFIEMDRHAFPSVITNLVSNAIKYSGNKPTVHVELKAHQGAVLLQVSDNGIGIAAHHKEKIFARFYRVGNEETRNSKGSGLGLFIVKYILDQHKALITVRDNKPRGSIFEIKLNAA